MATTTMAAEAGRFDTLARLGYAARGVVYLLVGGLAVLAAWGGGGGRTTDTRGALRTLLDEPFGYAMLGAIALGLVFYAVWRFIQAVMDADHHGTGAKGLAVRGGLLVSAVTHVLLALFVLSLIFGWGSGVGGGGGSGGGGGGGGGTQGWTAWLLSQPFGPWLVAAVGLAVIGAGIAQIAKGHKEKFRRHMAMGPRTERWAVPVSRFGLYAKGLVFLIIGGFLIVAAWQHDPSEARGLGGALATLQQQVYGQILLGIVAVGLIAFGVYSLLEARYRHIDAS